MSIQKFAIYKCDREGCTEMVQVDYDKNRSNSYDRGYEKPEGWRGYPGNRYDHICASCAEAFDAWASGGTVVG